MYCTMQPKLSMYSTWQHRSAATPSPFGLPPGQEIGLYDSRHRTSAYTVSGCPAPLSLISSSDWVNLAGTKSESNPEQSSSKQKKEVRNFTMQIQCSPIFFLHCCERQVKNSFRSAFQTSSAAFSDFLFEFHILLHDSSHEETRVTEYGLMLI